jgi:hypothetical protein
MEALADASETHDDPGHACTSCKGVRHPVTRKTVLLMLKPQCFDRMGESEYLFCAGPECPVVYFAEDGETRFTTDDLRVRVGLKERVDPIPLCYCFGFDEGDARNEITATGQCSIPQRISALIRRGMCACVERNPSGKCCVGEVNRAVKRLMIEKLRA